MMEQKRRCTVPARARSTVRIVVFFGVAAGLCAGQSSEQTLERHIQESLNSVGGGRSSKGSLFNSRSYLAELGRDPKAAVTGDLITIRVIEQASALSSGSTSSSRTSDASNSVSSLFGVLNPAAALANLAQHSGESTLDGQGSTSRQTSVTATITAHVTHVMPSGNLVIEGIKEVTVNSEKQTVWMRGMVRPTDLAPDNSVRSDRVAMMELRINGKGIVNDAIRRPNVLMRILKKILPF